MSRVVRCDNCTAEVREGAAYHAAAFVPPGWVHIGHHATDVPFPDDEIIDILNDAGAVLVGMLEGFDFCGWDCAGLYLAARAADPGDIR